MQAVWWLRQGFNERRVVLFLRLLAVMWPFTPGQHASHSGCSETLSMSAGSRNVMTTHSYPEHKHSGWLWRERTATWNGKGALLILWFSLLMRTLPYIHSEWAAAEPYIDRLLISCILDDWSPWQSLINTNTSTYHQFFVGTNLYQTKTFIFFCLIFFCVEAAAALHTSAYFITYAFWSNSPTGTPSWCSVCVGLTFLWSTKSLWTLSNHHLQSK